jgi:hypothetical protein
MRGKRQLEIRQTMVLRGGKRQGSKVGEDGADQNQKGGEEDFKRGGEANGCSDLVIFFFFFLGDDDVERDSAEAG